MLRTPEQFVAALQKVVIESTVTGELKVLRQPPGQAPWPIDVETSPALPTAKLP